MTSSDNESANLICPSCGYDLRAIPSERCPECGTSIDRTAMAVSTIPWAHRKTIGSVRAYRRTLILATFRIRRLGVEINRPVDLKEASRFRWITVAIASAFPIAVFVVAVCMNGGMGFLDVPPPVSSTGPMSPVPPRADFFIPWAAGITRWVGLPLAAIGWLGILSGLAGFWFHPRAKPQGQSDRALALSLYACGPLIGFSLFGAIALCSGMADLVDHHLLQQQMVMNVLNTASIVGVLLSSVNALLSWINLLRLLGFTLQPSMMRTVSLAIGWPIGCYISGLVAFTLIPWVVGFVWLMIDSLR